jgi:mono/diheme cytochrome c family protein
VGLALLVLVVVPLLLNVTFTVTGIRNAWFNRVPLPDLKSNQDPSVIAHGKYLFEGPAACGDCHVSKWAEFSGVTASVQAPPIGGLGFTSGGPFGRFGEIYATNLTPDAKTGIGRYTDPQLFRLLRTGIRADGSRVVLTVMPYHGVSDSDLVAIVSYLRALTPVAHEVPPDRQTVSFQLFRTDPDADAFPIGRAPSPGRDAPPEEPTVKRGAYLAREISNCGGCHTPHYEDPLRTTGPEFSGGEVVLAGIIGANPRAWFRAPNLTPVRRGVLKQMGTKDVWMARFRAGRQVVDSPMPWNAFSRMSDADLEALWLFFNSLKPIQGETGPTHGVNK